MTHFPFLKGKENNYYRRAFVRLNKIKCKRYLIWYLVNVAVCGHECLPPTHSCALVFSIAMSTNPHSYAHRARSFLRDLNDCVPVTRKQSAFHTVALIIPHRTLKGSIIFFLLQLKSWVSKKSEKISQEPIVNHRAKIFIQLHSYSAFLHTWPTPNNEFSIF